jgi:hypothetical protein
MNHNLSRKAKATGKTPPARRPASASQATTSTLGKHIENVLDSSSSDDEDNKSCQQKNKRKSQKKQNKQVKGKQAWSDCNSSSDQVVMPSMQTKQKSSQKTAKCASLATTG